MNFYVKQAYIKPILRPTKFAKAKLAVFVRYLLGLYQICNVCKLSNSRTAVTSVLRMVDETVIEMVACRCLQATLVV